MVNLALIGGCLLASNGNAAEIRYWFGIKSKSPKKVRKRSRSQYSDDEIIRRAKTGLALNLSELAVATGYSRSTVRLWHRYGMPLYDGRIILAEAMKWVRANRKTVDAGPALVSQTSPPTLRHPLLNNMPGQSGYQGALPFAPRPPRRGKGSS